MPLFEYKCRSCGAVAEQLVRSASDKPGPCPECGGRKLEKQLSSFSAAVSSGSSESLPPCASGACGTSSCATGSCPFSQPGST